MPLASRSDPPRRVPRGWRGPLAVSLAVLAGLAVSTSLHRTLGVPGVAAAPPQGPAGRIRAPELDGAAGYLNSAGPVRLQDLRGKIVLLDFWTLC